MSTSRKIPRYVDVDGYRCPPSFLPEIVRSAMRYQPTESDIFVVTYPKCGTTWMIQILLLLLRRGALPASLEEYFKSNVFLEALGPEGVSQMQQPGCIKTHFPLNLTQFSPRTKYIYVSRNPKDCCMSFYHHTKFFPMYFFSDGTFDDFFELFITGQTDFNDYFDHLVPWYERRNDANVFFTTFERMKADHRGTVLKVAQFLGDEYLEAVERDNSLLSKILEKSTLEYMRGDTNAWWKTYAVLASECPSDDVSPAMKSHLMVNFAALKEGHKCTGNFVRQGDIGEWKEVFTAQQEQRLNERIKERTKHSDVMSLWT